MYGGVASELWRDLNIPLPEIHSGTYHGLPVIMEKLGPIQYIKDRSEAIQLYYHRDSWTVGYINIKFVLKCYLTYHGYAKCKTEKVSKSNLIGGGPSNAHVDYKCPNGYYYFGTTCIMVETSNRPGSVNKLKSGTFTKAIEHCSGSSIVYSPVNQYQNAVFRSAMKEKV